MTDSPIKLRTYSIKVQLLDEYIFGFVLKKSFFIIHFRIHYYKSIAF